MLGFNDITLLSSKTNYLGTRKTLKSPVDMYPKISDTVLIWVTSLPFLLIVLRPKPFSQWRRRSTNKSSNIMATRRLSNMNRSRINIADCGFATDMSRFLTNGVVFYGCFYMLFRFTRVYGEVHCISKKKRIVKLSNCDGVYSRHLLLNLKKSLIWKLLGLEIKRGD